MSTFFALNNKRRQNVLRKCANMRAAKERKRLAEAKAMRDVGGFVTDGCLGSHAVRLLAYTEDAPYLAIMVDGQARRPRTYRGIMRCMALMVAQIGSGRPLAASRRGDLHRQAPRHVPQARP